MKISVIIPIYKAEKYIERCVRSLMEQTMKDDIEFIFVNDCTPDRSMPILQSVVEEYPQRESQVRIINNRQNIGPSDARKIAINAAEGEYIACCDADDWVESEMYGKMYQATEDGRFDIVVCNYRVEEREKSRDCTFISSSTPQDALSKLHDCDHFSYAMWNQLVRKDIIKSQLDNVVPTRIREDTYLMMYVYYYAENIIFIPGVYYHYFYEDETSLVHNYDDSYQAWLIQKQNMDNITKLLYSKPGGYEKYHYAMNNFKYARKQDYRNAFCSLKDFYEEYREAHADFIDCDSKKYKSVNAALKLNLIYNSNYLIFWIYNKFFSHGK